MHCKTLRGNSKGKAQRERYLIAVGLNYYKWQQSQALGGGPTRTLGPKGVDCEISHWFERGTKYFL